MISSENLSFLLGVLVFCGETIIPKGTRGSQLSFKFTIRVKLLGGDLIVNYSDERIVLTGNAVLVYEGEFEY